MPREVTQIIEAAQTALDAQVRELETAREQQMRAVVTHVASGTGSLDSTFGLERKYRLVFVRCHFAGEPGTAPLVLSVDSGAGSAHDARLFTIVQAGVDKDVHLRIDGNAGQDPSPWTFQAADRVRVQWINPAPSEITWGLEVGLALAA